jgi:hypothetical protein
MDKQEYLDYNLKLVEEAAKDPDMERKLARYEKVLQIEVTDLDVTWVLDTTGKTLKAYPGKAENPDDIVSFESTIWDRILSDPGSSDSFATNAAMSGQIRIQRDMYAHMPLLGIMNSLAKAKAKLG